MTWGMRVGWTTAVPHIGRLLPVCHFLTEQDCFLFVLLIYLFDYSLFFWVVCHPDCALFVLPAFEWGFCRGHRLITPPPVLCLCRGRCGGGGAAGRSV